MAEDELKNLQIYNGSELDPQNTGELIIIKMSKMIINHVRGICQIPLVRWHLVTKRFATV